MRRSEIVCRSEMEYDLVNALGGDWRGRVLAELRAFGAARTLSAGVVGRHGLLRRLLGAPRFSVSEPPSHRSGARLGARNLARHGARRAAFCRVLKSAAVEYQVLKATRNTFVLPPVASKTHSQQSP